MNRSDPPAEECGVRMANSQEDPATLPGYRGVDKVLNDFEGMKRFIEMQRSLRFIVRPALSVQFCLIQGA